MIYWSDMAQAGLLVEFFDANDPRPAEKQFDENYAHGGGFKPFKGFKLVRNGPMVSINYPEDPPMRLLSQAKLRDETLMLFEGSWLAIVQPDGSYRVCRCD